MANSEPQPTEGYNVDTQHKITPTLSLSARQLNGLLAILQHLEEEHLKLAETYPPTNREHTFNKGAAEAMYSLGEALVGHLNSITGSTN